MFNHGFYLPEGADAGFILASIKSLSESIAAETEVRECLRLIAVAADTYSAGLGTKDLEGYDPSNPLASVFPSPRPTFPTFTVYQHPISGERAIYMEAGSANAADFSELFDSIAADCMWMRMSSEVWAGGNAFGWRFADVVAEETIANPSESAVADLIAQKVQEDKDEIVLRPVQRSAILMGRHLIPKLLLSGKFRFEEDMSVETGAMIQRYIESRLSPMTLTALSQENGEPVRTNDLSYEGFVAFMEDEGLVIPKAAA